MSVPDSVRQTLRNALWESADNLRWPNLSTTAKSRQYEAWTRDPNIGGVLSRYIPLSDVRVYLKDTLLKGFAQDRLSDDSMPRRMLGLSVHEKVVAKYTKPHGQVLKDGRIICWGRAASWKTILMAAYERAHEDRELKAFGVILTDAVGRYAEIKTRKIVEDAAHRLGVQKVVWVE
jgi:hypothetical protein